MILKSPARRKKSIIVLGFGQHSRQIAAFLVPQEMARPAEGDQIFGVVAAAAGARDDMMDMKIARVAAAFAAALMAIAGQDCAA